MIKKSTLRYLLAASSISALMFSTSEVFASGNGDLLEAIRKRAGKPLKKEGPVVSGPAISGPVLLSVDQIQKTLKEHRLKLNNLKEEHARIQQDIDEAADWDDDPANLEKQKTQIDAQIRDLEEKLNKAQADLAEARDRKSTRLNSSH